MQKIMQKVTSVALAASMLFSMMSTTALAFADETGDSTSVSTDVTDAPAAEEADAVDSGSSNDADSSDATSAPTITDVVNLTHESYEDANSNDETTQDATSDVVDGEETSESDASDTEVSTPETAESTFVGLQTVTPEYGDKLTADVGDSITLDALLNRDDVSVTYQWQRKQNFAVDTALALYNYEEDEPTWYDFVWEDSTEAETLESTPDFTWQGCEMYFAIVDALDDIGADSSDVQVAWHTPNFVLDGYTITAANTKDGTVEVYASNGESTYTAHLNDDGKWEFSDESTANLKNDWQDIEGATESTYTFEVTEDDLFATYRCRITVTDEAYREENFKALEDLGNELTDEDKTGDIILQTVQFSISLPEDENSSDIAVRRMPATVAMLADTFSARATGGVAISSDNQWITGLDSNYEYITKNMYDQVTEWFNAGKIDKATADRYWTQIGGSWATTFEANALDDNKFPTGSTRMYTGFPLTDGDKLEVNSEWYGQTVYFRPHNDSNDWNLTGTAVSVPAYTAVLRNNGSYGTGASGTKYKDAVVFLNPWVSDAGCMYAKFLSHPAVSSNGWLKGSNGETHNQHITVLSVKVEQFNQDPDRYMMDAEGNYRIDSIGWGVCVNQEPDLSGKAYYAIKAFLSQGYGMCIGHDTMYAYAGSWYDAHEAGYTDPGSRNYYEGGRYGPDKNDTSTRYYVLNSVPNIDNGHWNMNALMGANGGNIDSGTVLPTDAISMILSTGGSHSSYGKAGIMYGSDQLSVKLKPYSSSQAQSTVKYRNPTNFPYDLSGTLSASKTHSNSQVAFGPIWVDYAGGNVTGAEFGYNPDPTTKTITDEETGQSWFGTSNFYLSGTGNFLMNQIGHLPENSATVSEARLFSNTVMYISQRKQCEICAAQQNGQEDVHFVIRVSSVNAQQVLSALQNGGTFWYPLNGCYQLTDDLTLPEGWKPIKNFSGHWNADVYKVKLASNNQPVFDNTSVTANGMYTSGKNNGWNLGSDMTKGTLPILKLDNQPDVRITGVARVVGDLNALFPTSYGVTDYTGYKVVVHGSDGVDYNCVVNSDSKYVISNLPTTGMMRADVIDKSGNKVTQFGMITVDVPNHFWNDTETHPLQLMTPTADPIDDYKDWEGPVNKTVDSKLYYNEQLKASDVVWYYRTISVGNQVGDWVKIGNPGTSFDTSDGTVSGKINSLTFTAATDSDLPYTTSSVSYSKLDYTTNRIQFKCEYNVSGTVYSSMDKAEDGRNGYVDVEIRPMYIEQAFDRRISVGGSTSFSFDAFYWKGVEDGLTYEVQYRDASGNWVAVGSDSTLFPSSKYKISYVTKTDDNDALGGGVWYPSDFWVPDSFTGSDAKMNAGKSTFNKHTTVTLELSNAAMDWDGTDFRCVFTYKSTGHTMSTDTTTANDIAQARTGHLILIDGVLEGDDVKIKEETLPGNYKTKDAGQKLNADGTVSSNWPYELDENPITADAHPTLTGKDAKNYRITKEKYSGAIARANLTAQVASWRGLYGDGVGEKPWHDKKAYGYGTAASAGCWLEIDGLVQGDTLTLDQSYKKSYFKTLVSGHENLVPDESTPVGTYPLTYVGLTEANYPVLKNYIVMVLNGRFVVDPRPLHVTVLDSDKIIYNENPNFHVNIQMEDDDANLIDVVSDVDATPILDAKLKAKDTVSSVLYVAGGNPSNLTQEFVDAYDYRKQENVKESKTNIPFVTDCTISSLPLYADGTSTDDDFEWNYEDKTCDFCHYNHKLLAPYLVTINTDTKSGPALDVHTVVNPNGETVRNYELIIHDGGLYVHPALLKATVPLYVCMYGNTTSGEVKEPTNYRITNYSTVAIQIKNIKANGPWLMRDMPGMEYYPDGEYGNSVYDMTKNRLRRGELYMRLRDTVLTQGDNAIDHSDTAWVIPKATGDFINNNITGRAMQVPMAVYIATGNVNESGVCTPVTKVTYTIAPYGGVMPNDADFEKVQSQPWLKDAK